MSKGVNPTITLTDEGDWWVARGTKTGVTSQGRRREAALDNLDEALAGYHGEGEAPSDSDLAGADIKPENNEYGTASDSEVFE